MEEGERIESWEDFEEKVKNFYSEVQKLKTKNGDKNVSTPLFRGQSDAKWELKSTLDRWKENFPVEKYHWIIQRIKPVILPYSERSNFLSKLNSMNINAYSLFETEEGLMNKLANEEFLVHGQKQILNRRYSTGKHSGGVMLG